MSSIVNQVEIKRFPDKIEEDGTKRIFLGENTSNPNFELYIWEKNEQIVKFDYHYDIKNVEKMLSWDVNNNEFKHSYIEEETQGAFGSKMIQISGEDTNIDWNNVLTKFEMKIQNLKTQKDQSVLNYMEFIFDKLCFYA